MTVTKGQTLVCWDVDLCLIKGGGFSHEIIRVAFCRHAGYWPDKLPEMPGRTDRAISLDLLAEHHRDSGELDAYLAHLEQAARDMTDRLRETGSVTPGALDALEALADDGRILAQTVVTGNMAANAKVKLGTLGVDHHIDYNIGGYGDTTVHRHELVESARRQAEAAYQARVPPELVVVVGDTPRDIDAAHKVGARAIGVATGHHTPDDLHAAGADHVLNDLADTSAVLGAVLGDRP